MEGPQLLSLKASKGRQGCDNFGYQDQDDFALQNNMFRPSLLDDAENSQTPASIDINPATEALLAQELSRLSMKERDEVLHDIHGVADSQIEDEECVKKCLEDLEETLSSTHVSQKVSYNEARNLDESYVTNEDFLLMFLRACSFDIKAAAARLISFFEVKKHLFGPEKLTQEITYDDLDEDDIQCLESGYAQVLSGRDRAGRAVFFLMPTIRKYRTLENRVSAEHSLALECSFGSTCFRSTD